MQFQDSFVGVGSRSLTARAAWLGLFGIAVLAGLAVAGPAWSQDKKPKVEAPKDVTLNPRDGWKIDATYYKGTAGKKAVPFIMIHGWGGRRGEFDGLARSLQHPDYGGHTSLTIDLRGHGGSVSYRTAAGLEKEVDYDDLTRLQIAQMVRDIDAAKRYLMARNNDGECNIEQLCVVAADVGAIVALNWAAEVDLKGRRLLNRSAEPGYNVKAMILLSPEKSFKGVTSVNSLQKHPLIRDKLSLLILAGNKDSSAFRESKRIYSSLKRFRPKLRSSEDRAKHQDLFLPSGDGDGIDTSVQGTKLLQTPANLRVGKFILAFIKARLLQYSSDLPWTERMAGRS